MSGALRPAGSTRLWRALRLAVLNRDAWRCQVPLDAAGRIVAAGGRPCHAFADTVDHKVPRAAGGDDSLDNLRAACRAHNLRKGARGDGEAGAGRTGPGRRWAW